MTDKQIRTLDDLAERIRGEGQEFVDSLLIESELVITEGPVVILWFTGGNPTTPYHVEGPYMFAEACEAVQEGMAEQARDLPDEPLPQVQMHVLRHREHNP